MQSHQIALDPSLDEEGVPKYPKYQKSSVRLLKIPRAAPKIEEYGFRLTRSKWDPYPWVNGIDIIGLQIVEIAQIVKSQRDEVTFLCWNSECKFDCDENSICCVPMPITLKRLVIIVDSILKVIECPVCNVTITPPVLQCQNGHLLCLDCRIRTESCPICRGFFTPIRSSVAEDIYSIIVLAFKHCRSTVKLRQKLFGDMALVKVQTYDSCLMASCPKTLKQRKYLLPPNKLLNKLFQTRSDSLEHEKQLNALALLKGSYESRKLSIEEKDEKDVQVHPGENSANNLKSEDT
ncbi:uncharacterized protein LOC6568015 isoform X2 [Drosophila grimshawi]|uniref:uncharacterized protein LOC6568015 isoform X2 n=1 Tax=Drosophila grimshawi TaxID=7222 RepID=UPI0013EF3519|nr:uncharacterized protein LOC6568015 isoform X2 [Drosophila grimshawi]